MSEIKPVYQVKRFDETGWADVTQESYKNCELAQTVLETRILYPAAAYEYMKNCADKLLAENKALKEKLERLNGLYHAEVSKHQLDYNALKAENEALQKENHDLRYLNLSSMTDLQIKNRNLEAEIEAQEKRINEQDLLIKILMSTAGLLGSAEQAKKIAELEEHVTKLGSGSRQHLYQAFARRYREILSLRRENEEQAKRIAELEKCIEILQRPLDDEIISRIIVLVANTKDDELAANVFEMVRNMTNWNKGVKPEHLVLFDQVAQSKNGDSK